MDSNKPASRINYTSNVSSFLKIWDDPRASDNDTVHDLVVSQFGNIGSLSGRVFGSGHAFSRYQTQFELSLEAGIKELVVLLVRDFDWITYTSCEGHHFTDSEYRPTERRVGLLPRSDLELDLILNTLGAAADSVNIVQNSLAVWIKADVCRLDSNDGSYSTVNLVFSKGPKISWEEYFIKLPEHYRNFLEVLGERIA